MLIAWWAKLRVMLSATGGSSSKQKKMRSLAQMLDALCQGEKIEQPIKEPGNLLVRLPAFIHGDTPSVINR